MVPATHKHYMYIYMYIINLPWVDTIIREHFDQSWWCLLMEGLTVIPYILKVITNVKFHYFHTANDLNIN